MSVEKRSVEQLLQDYVSASDTVIRANFCDDEGRRRIEVKHGEAMKTEIVREFHRRIHIGGPAL